METSYADEPLTMDEEETPVATKRILLLEDDEPFKGLLKEYLEGNGYEVAAVSNGVEGVKVLLGSDFDIIICDMMMPNLPGDMFYRAVERMRPHLCSRFVFITGLRGNCKVNDFIQKVNGTMLSKPFHLDDLLEVISFLPFDLPRGY